MRLYMTPAAVWYLETELDAYDISDCIPVCIRHKIPLHATESGQVNRGVCPECWFETRRMYSDKKPEIFTPQTWTWRPKAQYDPRDLPPSNGWKPVPIDEGSL